ncbi:hypothetical protein F0U60_32700 [Archangium minus]|uniref:Uncharacterized protein n=1 Tax=Archangium minus TaxID=83450 RepID=A0ABY9WYZ4_9BACT|nr:hypothetical protein F0U60_32700 [Archangium minus]
MDALTAVKKGLWTLPLEQRQEIYRDLRQVLGLSEQEPLLPLPEPALRAWCQRFAALLAPKLAQHPTTRNMADTTRIESMLLVYGQRPDDAFFESHVVAGTRLLNGGLPGLYLHVLLNGVAVPIARQAAREVLTPEQAALIEERYSGLMLLRHALLQEVGLGTGGVVS